MRHLFRYLLIAGLIAFTAALLPAVWESVVNVNSEGYPIESYCRCGVRKQGWQEKCNNCELREDVATGRYRPFSSFDSQPERPLPLDGSNSPTASRSLSYATW